MDLSCLDTSTCGYKEFQLAWAIHTLAHESFHLRGISVESTTECYAMQTTAAVARNAPVAHTNRPGFTRRILRCGPSGVKPAAQV